MEFQVLGTFYWPNWQIKNKILFCIFILITCSSALFSNLIKSFTISLLVSSQQSPNMACLSYHIHPIYPLLELLVHMCLGTRCWSSNTWSQLLYTNNNLLNGWNMDRTCYLKLLLQLLGLLWWVESKRNPGVISTFNWLHGCQMGNCHFLSETLFHTSHFT